ncbi:Uncharacterised protein [Mycobacteroides abscessus subsp. abscessus]|nr:Uncharacterised protein [Mycobacteroides abscessus subsp. abscessus]
MVPSRSPISVRELSISTTKQTVAKSAPPHSSTGCVSSGDASPSIVNIIGTPKPR